MYMKVKNLFAALISMCALLFVGCDNPGNLFGDGSETSDMTFEITISDITTSGATVSVVPSDDTALYYFDKVTKEEYKTYDNDNNFMKAMIEKLRAFSEENGSSLASAISVGEDSYTYNGELAPDTDYYIFAFAVDAKLNPNSALALKEFTTPEAKGSENTFQVSVNGGTITVTPSNNDQYFWDVVPSDTYQGKSDEYIMDDLINYYQEANYLEYYLIRGVDSYDFSQYLTSGTSYTVYVFGYEGMPTTTLTKYTFTYTSGNSSGGSTGDSSTTTLTGNVTLNVASIEAYYYGDYYEIGTNNWEIGFFDKEGYEFVYSEFFTVLNQNTPEGSYKIVGNAGDANTAFSGAIEEDYILPTYYAKFNVSSEALEAFALIAAGNFSIEKSGENYSVTLNLSDILGNAVTGSYTGAITVAKGEVESSQASVSGRTSRRAAHCALRRFSSAASIRPVAVSTKAARVK